MRINYRFAQLSKTEREMLEMILMEEVDSQAWYVITFSRMLGGELFVTVQ